ncbi:EcsC family protein [Pontibacter sp. G13]|uniref:EcsC family protein n=1 Tax=Pontibacter sp. G13 TaxID=3074898 RepID=UPI00288A1D92|nr:EcsC family protein [Pontibacter sp. G13]WNJ18230.1 EcsC family protein [Pontibacter sp. G13]
MAKLNSSETHILDEIAGWKAENPSFLNRATDFVSKPISWVTEKLTPVEVKNSVSGVTETIVEKLHDVSQWTVDGNDVLIATREFDIHATTIAALKKASIHDLDHVAEKFIDQNTRMGTLSGLGTGLVGWPGLIADLPTLFTLSLRSIYQIALCYGYDLTNDAQDPRDKAYEMEYMMRIFKVATSADKVQKQRSLAELKDFEAGRESSVYGDIGGDFATKQLGKNATSFVSRIIIKEIVERTITKKAAALIPGLGAVFSGGFNYVYLKDVGEAAFMLYRERFLLDKKGRNRTIKIEID